MNPIPKSELVLNNDGSVYHLSLHPENIAKTIILVGDPSRVSMVSKYFDDIDFSQSNREFVTHTGKIGKKRISVISTGIGTDNIDIVLNELDALVNIDLKKRIIKENLTSLNFIRIGTSGSLQPNIDVDTFLLTKYALGLDGLLHFYDFNNKNLVELQEKFINQLKWNENFAKPYFVESDCKLYELLNSDLVYTGITATAPGFYAPQGRELRVPIFDNELQEKLASFSFNNYKIANFEMETSAIFGLSKLMKHKAATICAIIANRAAKRYSKDHSIAIKELIKYVLEKIS